MAPTFPPYVLANQVIQVPNVVQPLPPIVLGQSCVCTLVSVCTLGYITVSGMGNIDPRLILNRQGQPPGTCNGANSMCCRITQDSISAPQVNPVGQSGVAPGTIKNSGTKPDLILQKIFYY